MGEEQQAGRPAGGYRCAVPYCDSTFADSYTLAEHLKMHAGEKRHICPVRSCGRRFSTPGNLSRHKRLHGPIKPLECPVENCICTFRSENKLAKHMRFHLGSAVHVCPAPACGKTFSTAGNLNRHIKGHHPKFDVRAAKALLASQSESMRIRPPVRLPRSPAGDQAPSVSSSDADASPSPVVSPCVAAPASVALATAAPSPASAFVGLASEKKPLGETLDPVQLDMLVSLLDIETPVAGATPTASAGGFATSAAAAAAAGNHELASRIVANGAWDHAVFPTPMLVLPASHGMLTDAFSAAGPSPFPTYPL